MDNEKDPHQKKIMSVYWLLGLAFALMLAPEIWAMVASTALFLGVLIAAYSLRSKQDHDSLLFNHMTFVIRTIWLTSFYAMGTLAVASFYMLPRIDSNPMLPCLNKILGLPPEAMAALKTQEVMAISMNCWPAYWSVNSQAIIIGGLIAGGPVLLYFLVRYARGLSRAVRGYRVANPFSWL